MEDEGGFKDILTVEGLRGKVKRVPFNSYTKMHTVWNPNPSGETIPVSLEDPQIPDGFKEAPLLDLHDLPEGSLVIVHGGSQHKSAHYVIRKLDPNNVRMWGPRKSAMDGNLNTISSWDLSSLDQETKLIDWYPGVLMNHGLKGLKSVMFMPYFDIDKNTGLLEKPKGSWMDTAYKIYFKKALPK